MSPWADGMKRGRLLCECLAEWAPGERPRCAEFGRMEGHPGAGVGAPAGAAGPVARGVAWMSTTR